MASEILDEKAIFNVARQIGSPDARAEYLRQACGADSGLRERVQDLLRAYEEQASFLESPPPVGVAPTTDQPASESPGAVIGPYKLIEQIGEGGMGTVWIAQQTEPVKRLVALKLIKAGMDSRQVIARFEAERQALALMDHVNIAKVLDGGTTPAGRPYFVMDLVKGVPITRYCDEHRLTPRQRLELFIPVCQAVQHAHQKGVIHRDLKPSNVLVALYDGKPVPKVIDFGVAKAAGQSLTEKTLVTGFGNIVGTLEYMSPEQAEINQLDIDTRSDVYSLGVLLYELLAGSPPFSRKELTQAGMLEMLRVIREQEPSKPSTKLSTAEGLPTLAANRGTEPAKLKKLVRGELDWIVMKALEKDRCRRYETANGFAMDVQRYLADEPVQACPPSASYRMRKFVRRHKPQVAAAALLVLALLSGVAFVLWHNHQLDQKNRELLAANRAEKQAKDRAEANFTLAEESVEKYLGTVTNDPDLRKSDFHNLRKKLLESAIPFFQKIAEQRSDDPEVEASRGMAYHRLALVRAAMAENEAAIKDFEAMRTTFARLAADFPNVPEYRGSLAGCHHNLANLLKRLGKLPQAEAAYRAGMRIRDKLAADFPTVPAYRRDLAASHGMLGLLLPRLGRRAEAETDCRAALKIQDKLAADFPAVPEYRQDLANMHTSLGLLLFGLGRRLEAEAAYRAGLTILDKLAADFPAVPEYRRDLAGTQDNLGNLLADLGKQPEAEAASRRAKDICEKLAADFPTVPGYAVDLAGSYCNYGSRIRQGGQPEAALVWFDKAIARLEPIVAKQPGLVTAREFLRNSHCARAMTLDALGRRAESARDWDRALELADGSARVQIHSDRANSRLRMCQPRKDTAGCLAAAAEYEALKRSDAAGLYDAACNRALCAAVIPDDPKTPAADKERLAKEQAELALAWLHKAIAAGYKDAEHMRHDPDLDALRGREDFKKLLAELENNKN